jgi:chromosome segregation ATPase
MSTAADHTHHIKVRSMQMEMPARPRSAGGDDYDYKLKAAEEELERIQSQREELARKKQELEELTARKRTFLSQQAELSEKLTSAITLIDRELQEVRQEADDLEQCRVCFASHLDKLQKINPESWTCENLAERLERSNMSLDIAVDEYDQAATHFENSRCGAIFGRVSTRKRAKAHAAAGTTEFMNNLRNGLAFNLPVYTLGGIALLVYLLK